jgi:hypothetical protein
VALADVSAGFTLARPGKASDGHYSLPFRPAASFSISQINSLLVENKVVLV